jgi:hypothetical protein
MKLIFSKLPDDIIKYILLFDKHFILRRGKLITIIPKTDYRYNLLNYITFQRDYIEYFNVDNSTRYNYYFPNLYPYEGRHIYNSDFIQVNIKEENDTIHYTIWVGRQKPKSFITNKAQIFYIENPNDYHWFYTEYKYIRC